MTEQNQFEIAPMSSKRRDLYFRIIDNYSDIHPITLRLYFLDEHFPPDKLDRALTWISKNGYVGPKFLNWFKHQCHGSDLEMHAKLLQVVDNIELPRVIAGKNFK